MNIITYPEKNTWADLLKRPTLQTESLRETVLEILNRIKFEGRTVAGTIVQAGVIGEIYI